MANNVPQDELMKMFSQLSKEELEQAFNDIAKSGTAFFRIDGDGGVTRIAPEKVFKPAGKGEKR